MDGTRNEEVKRIVCVRKGMRDRMNQNVLVLKWLTLVQRLSYERVEGIQTRLASES